MNTTKKTAYCVLAFVSLILLTCLAAEKTGEKPSQQFEQQRRDAAKEKREAAQLARARKAEEEQLAKVKLPEDTSPRLTVQAVSISGNTLITTDELLKNLPAVFNASDKPLSKADSKDLYDFTSLRQIIAQPGQTQQVSARTIQGFTQYVLSAYQDRNYAGIYVYVPTEALQGQKLTDDVLAVRVLEAPVIDVGVTHYDVNQVSTLKGYLDSNAVLAWSPVKPGEVANKKRLDDFVNLLNLNPDRYVTAKVSKGAEPNTLAVNYGIYETDPWHWFLSVDNSGTKDRQWNPRIGVINTNLLGRDDTFMAMYQAPLESDIADNYSLFGSYDFPLTGPELRLMLYGGYSEFDISPQASDIDFVGGGKFIGTQLRYNFLQAGGWFFDAIGGISREESRITPSLFPEFLESNVRMNLWAVGAEAHKRDDMTTSSLALRRTASMGASDESEFTIARMLAEPYFSIYTLSVAHSRYLDPNKVARLSGTFRWVTTEDRLAPAKMTTFGGMYTVRGYDEYEIVADGGILFSAQYEFDLVRYEKVKGIPEKDAAESEASKSDKYRLKKLAPLAFFDFGRSMINEPTAAEESHETLASLGIGTLLEVGDNFSGAVYYGWPLKATDDTRRGKGRLNVGLMMRW